MILLSTSNFRYFKCFKNGTWGGSSGVASSLKTWNRLSKLSCFSEFLEKTKILQRKCSARKITKSPSVEISGVLKQLDSNTGSFGGAGLTTTFWFPGSNSRRSCCGRGKYYFVFSEMGAFSGSLGILEACEVWGNKSLFIFSSGSVLLLAFSFFIAFFGLPFFSLV